MSIILAQEKRQFYLEIKEGYELGNIEVQSKSDNSLQLSMNNKSFESFINSKSVYEFRIAFKHAIMPRLKRIYYVEVDENTSLNDFFIREEVFRIEEIFEEEGEVLASNPIFETNSFSVLPNDYNDILSGERNPDLDLIRAPQAWQITRGSPDVLVGVVDSKVDLTHEDLVGQIVQEYSLGSNRDDPHGTGVASLIAGKTNNNKGIASVAHESKLVVSTTTGYEMLDSIASIENVRVINCSWRYPSCDDVYNWYNAEGNLIYSGSSLNISPEFTQTYKLEVIADLDGYKDYDEVNISVNPFALTKLVPNPASSDLRVDYTLDDATTSAYIMVVHQVTGSSNNYILDIEEEYIDLDISLLPTGIYTVLLIADGEIKASKGLIKQ